MLYFGAGAFWRQTQKSHINVWLGGETHSPRFRRMLDMLQWEAL